MRYGFDTDDEHAAVAALLIYAIWRSRDYRRFKITPDVWGQVRGFVKGAAKRSRTLPQFIEALMPRLCCTRIRPKWIAVGARGEMPLVPVMDPDTGAIKHIIQFADQSDMREFGVQVIERADAKTVIDRLYRDTAYCILLCQERLERERAIEKKLAIENEEDSDEF